MPSALTDEARRAHYGKMREYKKWIDKAYALGMGVFILLAVLLVLPTFYFTVMSGMFLFKIKKPVIDLLFVLLMYGLQFAGIGTRKWQYTAGAAAAWFVSDTVGFSLVAMSEIYLYFSIAFVILTVYASACHIAWHKLSQEEGFPDFDISFEERGKQQKQAEAQHRHRILQEEATAAAGSVKDMTDLLDPEQKTMPAELTAYRDRHTLTAQNAGNKDYVPGEMDEL